MSAANDTPADRDDRRAVWSRYWAGGALHSCGGSFDGNYSGDIREFWREAFAPLGEGSRLLDIATGNGPIPKLLLTLRPGVDVHCDAVDLAAVAPAWPAELPEGERRRLQFHPRVEAEALPFADARFDLVVSQYGLEYSQLARSVPELLRVLKSSGRVRLLAHHAASVPVTLAREELRQIDWLRSPAGLLAAAAPMLGPMARAATPEGRAALRGDAVAHSAREAFDRSQSEREARATASSCPDILHETAGWIAQAFQAAHTGGEARGREALARIDRMLDDARLRLQELCDHALDEAGARALCDQLGQGGRRSADAVPLRQEGRLMAWAIRAG
ncbi:class I SAM-dependent methyltransferase [Arenimonas terrae]|uniref:Class I SAM-dependent methyltransferase n=1 Tax=Arenimonas terrae TaxID=2546226 RepID=A0A5C4RRV9_9GAMM|nr:class I SAM-dependent methyltransferase [Arenimonas terrae]TNJ33694.1 class I SAM-dependent methyltransferase [Arenimonas terrae]